MVSQAVIIRICFMLLAAFSFSLNCRADTEDLSKAVKDLESLKSVDGSAVGYAGTPGHFYKLAQIISAKGSHDIFIQLTKAGLPINRCMGLYCLAITDDSQAVPVLKASLSDPALIEYGPGGCVFTQTSVGAFAFELLHNRNPLDFSPESQPLLGSQLMDELALSLLSDDRYTHLRSECERVIGKCLILDPDIRLASLRSRFPNLNIGAIIKAFGRLEPNEVSKRLLLECITSSEADGLSKMTAWSALTQYATSDVFEALRANRSSLDSLGDGFGPLIQGQLETTWRHLVEITPVKNERTWRGQEAIKDQIIRAYSMAEPIALDDLHQSFGLAIVQDHADVKKTVVSSLITLSKKGRKYEQPWSTYSNLSYRLRDIVRAQRFNPEPGLDHGRILDEAACQAIEANL